MEASQGDPLIWSFGKQRRESLPEEMSKPVIVEWVSRQQGILLPTRQQRQLIGSPDNNVRSLAPALSAPALSNGSPSSGCEAMRTWTVGLHLPCVHMRHHCTGSSALTYPSKLIAMRAYPP